jgi:hypothetical protein
MAVLQSQWIYGADFGQDDKVGMVVIADELHVRKTKSITCENVV